MMPAMSRAKRREWPTRLGRLWEEKAEWRKTKGLTQAKAQEILGFQSPSSITQYFNGSLKLSLEVGTKFAEMLEVDLVDVWEDEDLEIPGFIRSDRMDLDQLVDLMKDQFSAEEVLRFLARLSAAKQDAPEKSA